MELDISKIEKIDVSENDILIFKVEGMKELPQKTLEAIHSSMKEASEKWGIPGRVIVIDKTTDVEVVHKTDNA